MSGTVNTAVDVANLALAHLKEAPIRDFDYSSVASRWFRNHYASFRDAYLAQHDWDFAIELTRIGADGVSPPFRWKYRYRKPNDALRIPQQTVDGAPDGALIRFEVAGQWIMTDRAPPLPLRYISRVTRESEFSPLFVHGFALFLASGCAHVITGKNSRAQELREAASQALESAETYDAGQGTPLPMADLEIIEGR
ncbi:hypothetical protein [Labrenzia sp. OB1]|uniref:hypothetical protein n=1 Tax=Labrenzia sp. OB1 TaxID=1561204 RepID=UPI0007B2E519|nr:hypothetical protein [Labrenzia sp. OB1]KZM47497.1 hypothetical protein OA90_25535 [Labrenzia sp. OB1]